MKINALTTAGILAITLSATPVFAKKDKLEKGHDPHMSSQGIQNTNSSHSLDKDKGQDRASERMSDSGTSNSHSGTPQKGKDKKAK